MARRKPWWMSYEPAPKRPVVFAVLPWRGDGVYRLTQAVKVYRRRHAAERFADADVTHRLVVRELDAPPGAQ